MPIQIFPSCGSFARKNIQLRGKEFLLRNQGDERQDRRLSLKNHLGFVTCFTSTSSGLQPG
uniref:Uncharacterized protein n=1 Tax=mine drainage metagenome TaxID=410659 RepID=E6QJD5_9ZZZZ